MGRNKKQLTVIEENSDILFAIDNHKHDRTITVTEFKVITSDQKKQIFDGKDIADWTEFKKQFIDRQGEIGFIWSNSQGYGGPLRLEHINLPAELGSELAKKLHDDNVQSGNFKDVLTKYLPKLHKFIDEDTDLLKYAEAKEEFKIPDEKSGLGFKFKQNSLQFERKQLEYKFISDNGRHHETDLGEVITPYLKEMFQFDFINHTQSEREEKKYKNIDIEGIKIFHTESEDLFDHYSFELKASNSIPSISESISQAINYKSYSNYTFIVIPNFDYENFYDEYRLREYIEMCRQNRVGIISVSMKGNIYQELNTILESPKSERMDHSRVISLSQKKEFLFEKCHLCGKIVTKDHRQNCGWRVSIEGEEVSHCMKLLQQEQTELYLKSKQSKDRSEKDSTVISD